MTGEKGRGPSGGVDIVPADPADLDAIVELARGLYADEGRPFEAASFRTALSGLLSSDAFLGRVLLVSDRGEAVGYLVLTLGYSLEFGGRDSFIDELYLRPSHRGRGLGRRALARAEAVARTLGVRAIHLEVKNGNDLAQGLYVSSGFEHRDHHLMTKHLER